MFLGLPALRDLALSCLIKASIIDADGRLTRNHDQKFFMPRRELGRLRVTEEEPAHGLARSRLDRHG